MYMYNSGPFKFFSWYSNVKLEIVLCVFKIVIPKISYRSYLKIISNMTFESSAFFIIVGEERSQALYARI
jgi:hypothetical protein